jgi:hypothetical protein
MARDRAGAAVIDLTAAASGRAPTAWARSGGWGVLDFWESRTQFDSFAAGRIGPGVQAAGITAEPEIHGFPVHEYLSR